ncbi:LysR family transcriptional regulator [Enterococcus ureilyticus]|uniref:LysR family transcriptional regulator n=1 Tax=Enterococcus ureilyticus TaxID=1131292 RepID=A0A1E5HAP6_9ENTE|nr:LysR family transcriptional regulator [Enterococcus ureilyticus]MBM7688824.1 DNA-binding transcriptional LysR family regulator [Enterococcus ureilyticus]MBO0446484.1 LysR family transcriptional regulator [Enterococcus ureilyticus]OEG22028.1 LysR family transcriptional regulator [Enterococcus ureilyticus]
MRIKQLDYIVKIVELGSVNEAAKHLFITQPSLSSAVKELEQEMGIQIFRRTQKGMVLTIEGTEFLSYARQILEQVELMEGKYKGQETRRRLFSVSAQHYAFAVHAFVQLIKSYEKNEYEFTFRETQTNNIIEDVSTFQSELGILYLNSFNENVIRKLLKEKQLTFHSLFTAHPHVFVSKKNPLVGKKSVTLNDLENFPYLSFEQGQFNSFHFSEEILSTLYHKKSIRVSDRATLFNFLIGLDGYTISSGVLSRELNDENIVALPLEVDETMEIGWIHPAQMSLSPMGNEYLRYLKEHIIDYGFTISNDE